MSLRICPECEGTELSDNTDNVPIVDTKGEEHVLRNKLTFYYCHNCDLDFIVVSNDWKD